MKAFLLAGGKGTRLKPLTDTVPKCLVPINGRPLLEYWFRLCWKYGISDVLINLSHLPDAVSEYVLNNAGDLHVTLAHEPVLLGSGGTIKANADFVRDEPLFFICYADTLTNVNLATLAAFHKRCDGVITMGLFRTSTPETCGIAEIDRQGRVTTFVEKPPNPRSNLASAGVFVATPAMLDHIPNRDVSDLGHDVLPRLVGQMYGYVIREYVLDIGTPASYARAQDDVRRLDW